MLRHAVVLCPHCSEYSSTLIDDDFEEKCCMKCGCINPFIAFYTPMSLPRPPDPEREAWLKIKRLEEDARIRELMRQRY